MSKQQLVNLIETALKSLQSSLKLPEDLPPILIETPKDKQHGDFASNIALVLAKIVGQNPRQLAASLIKALPASPLLLKTELAGPGFINFFLAPEAFFQVIPEILTLQDNFGLSKKNQGKTILLEFVSSNPTGPLHVGHGRHAVLGEVVGRLLEAVGYEVYREYYVNDAGRQMDIVAVSLWLRYLELGGEKLVFPANAYRGSYIIELAEQLRAKWKTDFLQPVASLFKDLPLDEPQGGDKEIYIDALIERAKASLKNHYQEIFDFALEQLLRDMREDLEEFGVHYDRWFAESELTGTGKVDKTIETLRQSGQVYEREGALWFRSSDFGDEKDRVLVRANGQRTYFANDVAYHLSKFERGFQTALGIFGADHHGYVPRMQAAMKACGIDPSRLQYLIVQFVTLYRSGKQVQMSTRGGSFVTLRELRQEVGKDAARFFYLMRKFEQHIDFDLDLAKSHSNDNPVYYVQYAYARICSVFRQLKERGMSYNEALGLNHLPLLKEEAETALVVTLARYPEVISMAAAQHEPYFLTHYLRELATSFHVYYNSCQFLVEDDNLRQARLTL
ncbi:MAG TPA: arginine--tRNA ligase, partial [Gammaproteobacteria bacterium]|nr:arginine--tRNA ligase [Gammaproteobacteria bacterium]